MHSCYQSFLLILISCMSAGISPEQLIVHLTLSLRILGSQFEGSVLLLPTDWVFPISSLLTILNPPLIYFFKSLFFSYQSIIDTQRYTGFTTRTQQSDSTSLRITLCSHMSPHNTTISLSMVPVLHHSCPWLIPGILDVPLPSTHMTSPHPRSPLATINSQYLWVSFWFLLQHGWT